MLGSRMGFPFYDDAFNIIRAPGGLDAGAKPEKLESLMLDVDRISRAGALLWLHNFYHANEETKKTLTRLIEGFGYKKRKWAVGANQDASGSGKLDAYSSAVLQKSLRL